ncbi:MAG: cation transporter [Chloroflexia bacterium]|nr:cation transporter [Chloroflexia bacterium]MDQ3512154.1 cation diffusion facilitator family transporter [Chloroflexota bacterium]
MLVVLGLNGLVAAMKLSVGVLTGSVAMAADGVQSLLDGFANVIGLIGIVAASRPPDEQHPYGHERYETIASMAIAGLMTFGVVEIVRSAWGQFQGNDEPRVTALSFAVLIVTIGINAGVSWWERRAARRLRSELLAADAKHTATDVVVSAGVIVGLIAVAAGFTRADAVVSLVIAAVIARTAWVILRDASLVLSDATAIDPRLLMRAVLTAPGVVTAHNLRARSGGGRSWVEVHVTVDPDLRVNQAHAVATGVEEAIRTSAGDTTEVVVHVEPAEPPHTRPDPLFGDPRST